MVLISEKIALITRFVIVITGRECIKMWPITWNRVRTAQWTNIHEESRMAILCQSIHPKVCGRIWQWISSARSLHPHQMVTDTSWWLPICYRSLLSAKRRVITRHWLPRRFWSRRWSLNMVRRTKYWPITDRISLPRYSMQSPRCAVYAMFIQHPITRKPTEPANDSMPRCVTASHRFVTANEPIGIARCPRQRSHTTQVIMWPPDTHPSNSSTAGVVNYLSISARQLQRSPIHISTCTNWKIIYERQHTLLPIKSGWSKPRRSNGMTSIVHMNNFRSEISFTWNDWDSSRNWPRNTTDHTKWFNYWTIVHFESRILPIYDRSSMYMPIEYVDATSPKQLTEKTPRDRTTPKND